MLRIASLIGTVGFGAVLFVACGNAIQPPPDDDASTDTGPAPKTDAGKDSGGNKDSGQDATSTCDGQCVPSAPAGWTFVAFDDKARNPCPTSFGTSKDTIADVTGADATCGCSCSVASSPTCDGNSLKYYIWDDSSCSSYLTANGLSISGCTSESIYETSSSTIYVQAWGSATISGGSCNTPTSSKSVPPYVIASEGRSCAINVAVQACPGSKMCVPNVAAPDQLCIVADGDNNCPTGYPNLHLVGDGVDDTRDCSACSCTAQGSCADPDVEFHQDSSCKDSSPIKVPGDGTCTSIGSDTMSTDYVLMSSTASGVSCDPPTSFGPTGSVDLKNTRTICCK